MGTIYKNTLYEKPVIWPKYNEKSVNHITLNDIEVYSLKSTASAKSGSRWYAGATTVYFSFETLEGVAFEIDNGNLILLRDVPKITITGSVYLNAGGDWAAMVVNLLINGASKTIFGKSSAPASGVNGTHAVSYTITDLKKGDVIRICNYSGSGTVQLLINTSVTITALF